MQFIIIMISVIPHITDAIQEWVERVAKQPVSDDKLEPDVRLLIVFIISLVVFCILHIITYLLNKY